MSRDWWGESAQVASDLAKSANPRGHDTTALSLQLHLLRLGLIAQLEPKGWFNFGGSESYLTKLWELWGDGSGPYSFAQRLNLLFTSGLSQPSKRARELVAAQVGTVPYLGTGLFEAEPGDNVDKTKANQWFWLGGGMESAVSVRQAPVDSSLRKRCKALAESNKTDVWSIHLHDPEAGTGEFLAAMLSELLEVLESPADEFNDDWPGALLKSHLSGLSNDPSKALVARFRLGSIALCAQSGTAPVPLPDMSEVVRCGVALPVTSPQPMVEGPELELKASLEWNVCTGERSPDLKLGVLKSVAAFMNGNGGRLFIGLADDGVAVGLDHELAPLRSKKPLDAFEGKLREFLKNHLDPAPFGAVSINFPVIQEKTVCLVEVQPAPHITYLLWKGADGRVAEDIYVRDGNRTVRLTGRDRDRFVLLRGL